MNKNYEELVLFEFPREAPFGIGFGLDISHCWVMFRSVQVYLTQCPAGYVNFGTGLAYDGLGCVNAGCAYIVLGQSDVRF